MSDNLERRAPGVARRRAGSASMPLPRPSTLAVQPTMRVARGVVMTLLPLTLSMSACSWFTDFKRQPKVDPWESPSDTIAARGNPQMSVPITGTAVAGFQVSYQQLPVTIDSMSGIANPTPVSDSSLANGHRYFQINCAVCHGDRGMGDGPATKYGMPGIGIGAGSPAANVRTDGYIFGMIRNGRGLMPSYDRIEEMDRWDVVNYLRGLQGKLGKEVPVGPLGYPGQTGTALPGYSRMAPTRPSPYRKPDRLNTGGVSGMTPAPAATEPAAPAAPGAHTADTSAAARKSGGPQ